MTDQYTYLFSPLTLAEKMLAEDIWCSALGVYRRLYERDAGVGRDGPYLNEAALLEDQDQTAGDGQQHVGKCIGAGVAEGWNRTFCRVGDHAE